MEHHGAADAQPRGAEGSLFKKVYRVHIQEFTRWSKSMVAVYLALTLYCGMTDPKTKRPRLLASRPRGVVAGEAGIKEGTANQMVKRLCAQTFFWGNTCKEVPVLTKVRDAHRGHTAVYCDNLTAYALYPDALDPFDLLDGIAQGRTQ